MGSNPIPSAILAIGDTLPTARSTMEWGRTWAVRRTFPNPRSACMRKTGTITQAMHVTARALGVLAAYDGYEGARRAG